MSTNKLGSKSRDSLIAHSKYVVCKEFYDFSPLHNLQGKDFRNELLYLQYRKIKIRSTCTMGTKSVYLKNVTYTYFTVRDLANVRENSDIIFRGNRCWVACLPIWLFLIIFGQIANCQICCTKAKFFQVSNFFHEPTSFSCFLGGRLPTLYY